MSRGSSSPEPVDSPAAVGQQLLAEFIRYGRQRPFEEIVRRYAGMVFNVCFRVTKDKHDAEDATQAVFLTLAVQAKRGAEIKALGPWLQQVAKRLSLDVKRGQKRRKNREEKHHDDQTRRRTAIDEEALPSPDLEELKLILHEELQKLPAKYRLPLILHYFGGMTRDEMAAELNCKPSTLGVRIFRGREMLAGRLNGRGVHLSAGAMAVAIGYLVKHTVTGSMIARTSHAAAALASGSADFTTVGQLMASHAGSAEAAARVIGLTRRASHVLVIGKVRVTVAIALITGTSLGAGVKAFAMLPSMDMGQVRQMISAGVTRLVKPLVEPLTRPLMRADTSSPPPSSPSLRVDPTIATNTAGPIVLPPTFGTPSGGVPTPTVPPGVGAVAATTVTGVVPPAIAPAPVDTAKDPAPSVTTAAPERPYLASVAPVDDATDPASASHRSGELPAVHAATPPLLASSSSDASASASQQVVAGGSSGDSMTASAANDLYVPAGGTSSPVYSLGQSSGSATSAQIIQIPAVGGSVSESNGVVRGYGRIAKTGTLAVSGKVVADGGGVDRTLDLTGFTSVQTASAASASGWYAADHGRLSLTLAKSTPTASSTSATTASAVVGPVVPTSTPTVTTSTSSLTMTSAAPSTTATTLTWGADPSASILTPVNSVRLTVLDGPVPSTLSLLSPDRSDAPPVPSTDGAPIGLWEVDSGTAPLSAVDIVVRYDDHLVDELGGLESAVRLWTMGDPSTGWQTVNDGTFSLDLTDHIVSGSATDVSYFTVTVPPAANVDVSQIVAHPAAGLAPLPSTNIVPEPSSIAVVTLAAAGLLGRRRRRPAEIRSSL